MWLQLTLAAAYYNKLVGQHGFAHDFYYQLSLLLSLYVFLSLSLSISLSLCLSLSLSPPLFPDKKLPALDSSLETSHLYIRR
jgi:hypothetical protein